MLNGNHWILHEVRNFLKLCRNLILVGQLGDEGCVVTFNDKNWKVSKGSLVVEKGVKVGTLYLCTGHVIPSTLIVSKKNECLEKIAAVEQGDQIVAVDSDTALWHNRLGHMSEEDMKVLHSKKFLLGLKCVNINFCESRVYGKQKRVSFVKNGKEKKDEKLELVHTNVWDQIKYLPLVALTIMLHLLMMQLEKYGFISLNKNPMYFKLLRNGNAWLKMRLVKG